MIKNISDKTIRLTIGNIYLTELPSGWSQGFDPEIEDFLAIKYAGMIKKNPPQNKLIEKVKEMIKKQTKPQKRKTKKSR